MATKKQSRFEYLSWSKMNAVEQGEEVFVERYIDQVPIDSPYLTFGKNFALAAEKGKSKDFTIDCLVKSLPSGKPETKMTVEWNGIMLLAYFDRYAEKERRIREFKTGTKLWTLKSLQDCGQTKFYSFIHWKKFGEIPFVDLVSIETEKEWIDDELVITPTGRTRNLEIQYTKQEMYIMANRINDDWKLIQKFLKKYGKT